MEYTTDEYSRAHDTVDLYDARAITVLRNCGVKEVLKWFENCEETFVNAYTLGDGEVRVRVVLFRGYEYEPNHQVFEFPWELMNTANVHIPDAYAKWRKEEDERLAARKAAKDKHWAEVRARYLAEHPEETAP